MNFIDAFISSFPLFSKALLLTLSITVSSLVLSLPIGLFFTALKLTRKKPLERIAELYIYIIRGTPLIVQIFVLYFGLTNIIRLNAFISASLALAVHNGAYISEIFRGAIGSISVGQFEAAKSLGMSKLKMYYRIIIPQAFKRSIPSLGNQFIITLKDSSLAAFISMNELFNVATTLGANSFDQMTYLLIVSVYYLVLVFAFTYLMKLVEKRFHYAEL
ncbi:amino acid ABC transporter permease [Bacteriovorax sp. DB6_IX]|uniref:amino acid ABC transporter permease n=1 Tax=Bacteriovorax sp. DB6_IX TaxID=1353530 RepID=UPI00038A2E9B|nr:amino acid ABC transporter permease [Bacteriovorax sp. DB6_IX]EQC50945.1 ABC transporter, permease protein [Bacteriovorax sp. DB6_IX]